MELYKNLEESERCYEIARLIMEKNGAESIKHLKTMSKHSKKCKTVENHQQMADIVEALATHEIIDTEKKGRRKVIETTERTGEFVRKWIKLKGAKRQLKLFLDDKLQ